MNRREAFWLNSDHIVLRAMYGRNSGDKPLFSLSRLEA